MDDLLSNIDNDILNLICDKIECVFTVLNLKYVNKFWNKLAKDLLPIIRKKQENRITLQYESYCLQRTGTYEIVNKILQDYDNSYIENNFLDLHIRIGWDCRNKIIIPAKDKIINDTDIDNLIDEFRYRYKSTDFQLIKEIAYTIIDYKKRKFNFLVTTKNRNTPITVYYGLNERKSNIEYPVIYKDKKLTYPSTEKFILFNLNKDDIIKKYLEKNKHLHLDIDYLNEGYIKEDDIPNAINEFLKMFKK